MTDDDIKTWSVKSRFRIGDIVYHRLRDEPRRGMVTGIFVRPTAVLYYVTWPDGQENCHHEIELTGEFVPCFEGSSQ